VENTRLDSGQQVNTVRIPKFGPLSGIGAIVTYLTASIPVTMIAAIILAINTIGKNINEKLEYNEFTDKLNDLLKNPSFLVLIISANCIGLFIYAFLVSRLRGTKNMKNDFGLHFSPSSLWFILVGIGLQLASLIITLPISIIRDEGVKQQQIATDLANANGSILFAFAFMVAIVVPFTEELCFRGIFLRGLMKKTTPVVAILISGLVFAAIHLSDPNALYGFSSLILVGIFTSALTIYRGKIDASIALHVGFNLTAAVFLILN
jgi:membrane protease YdiL (CAAX protease family)